MMRVEIRATKLREADQGNVSCIVESHRANTWTRESATDLTPSVDGTPHAVVLEAGQRLVIEHTMPPATRYDKDQAANVGVDLPAPPPGSTPVAAPPKAEPKQEPKAPESTIVNPVPPPANPAPAGVSPRPHTPVQPTHSTPNPATPPAPGKAPTPSSSK